MITETTTEDLKQIPYGIVTEVIDEDIEDIEDVEDENLFLSNLQVIRELNRDKEKIRILDRDIKHSVARIKDANNPTKKEIWNVIENLRGVVDYESFIMLKKTFKPKELRRC